MNFKLYDKASHEADIEQIFRKVQRPVLLCDIVEGAPRFYQPLGISVDLQTQMFNSHHLTMVSLCFTFLRI